MVRDGHRNVDPSAAEPYPNSVVRGIPAGRTCCRNRRTPIVYRSTPPPSAVPARGITGMIGSGVTYLAMAVGSRVPPGTAVAAAPVRRSADGTNTADPATTPALTN